MVYPHNICNQMHCRTHNSEHEFIDSDEFVDYATNENAFPFLHACESYVRTSETGIVRHLEDGCTCLSDTFSHHHSDLLTDLIAFQVSAFGYLPRVLYIQDL